MINFESFIEDIDFENSPADKYNLQKFVLMDSIFQLNDPTDYWKRLVQNFAYHSLRQGHNTLLLDMGLEPEWSPLFLDFKMSIANLIQNEEGFGRFLPTKVQQKDDLNIYAACDRYDLIFIITSHRSQTRKIEEMFTDFSYKTPTMTMPNRIYIYK